MNKIRFVSDDNEIELVEKIIKDKAGKSLTEYLFAYKYTKSETKFGFKVFFTKSQIDRMVSDGRMEILAWRE